MWKHTSKKKYEEMLGILPPAYQDARGFLVGEPADHYKCDVCGETLPRYEAYVQSGTSYFASIRPMTIYEYKAAKIGRRRRDVKR
jgi:hypothetical protein